MTTGECWITELPEVKLKPIGEYEENGITIVKYPLGYCESLPKDAEEMEKRYGE